MPEVRFSSLNFGNVNDKSLWRHPNVICAKFNPNVLHIVTKKGLQGNIGGIFFDEYRVYFGVFRHLASQSPTDGNPTIRTDLEITSGNLRPCSAYSKGSAWRHGWWYGCGCGGGTRWDLPRAFVLVEFFQNNVHEPRLNTLSDYTITSADGAKPWDGLAFQVGPGHPPEMVLNVEDPRVFWANREKTVLGMYVHSIFPTGSANASITYCAQNRKCSNASAADRPTWFNKKQRLFWTVFKKNTVSDMRNWDTPTMVTWVQNAHNQTSPSSFTVDVLKPMCLSWQDRMEKNWGIVDVGDNGGQGSILRMLPSLGMFGTSADENYMQVFRLDTSTGENVLVQEMYAPDATCFKRKHQENSQNFTDTDPYPPPAGRAVTAQNNTRLQNQDYLSNPLEPLIQKYNRPGSPGFVGKAIEAISTGGPFCTKINSDDGEMFGVGHVKINIHGMAKEQQGKYHMLSTLSHYIADMMRLGNYKNAWGDCKNSYPNIDYGQIAPSIHAVVCYGTIIFKYNVRTYVLESISPIFFFQAHGFRDWRLDSWLQFATSIDHSDNTYEIGYGEDDVFCRIASIPEEVLHSFMNEHEIYVQDSSHQGWEDDYFKKIFMLVPDGFVQVDENAGQGLINRYGFPTTQNHTIYTVPGRSPPAGAPTAAAPAAPAAPVAPAAPAAGFGQAPPPSPAANGGLLGGPPAGFGADMNLLHQPPAAPAAGFGQAPPPPTANGGLLGGPAAGFGADMNLLHRPPVAPTWTTGWADPAMNRAAAAIYNGTTEGPPRDGIFP